MKFVTLPPLLVRDPLRSYLVFLVYSEDTLAAFRLHFVSFLQVPMCHLLECILSI